MCASVCIIDGGGANGDSKMEEEEESEKYCNIELKAAAVVSFPTQGHKFPMPKLCSSGRVPTDCCTVGYKMKKVRIFVEKHFFFIPCLILMTS